MTPDDLRPSRRDLLRWGGGTLAVASLTSCSFLSTDPTSEPGAAGVKAKNAKEAPALSTLVEQGKLPKLAERMPKIPLVVQNTESVGVYGGTWRSVLLNAADTSWLARTIGYETLLRWDTTGTKVIPNIAEGIEGSDDGREFRIRLREGMKWSDGQPFTADDLMFAYNDVMLNKEISPVVSDYITSDGVPAKLEKVDTHTVLVTFPKPNGLFYRKLAYQGALISYPRHYLEQFHKDHNPEAVRMAKEEKLTDWTDLFGARADRWANADLPTLCAWEIQNPLGTGNQVVAVRNPYYWKTDPNGSQLPYIDRVVFNVISDAQVILLRATAGEIDMSTRHINTLPNKPVLASGRGKGKYHFITLENTVMNDLVLSLNLNHKDPVLRQIFQNKDFRIGLSHAIDRPEMIKSVWQRQGVPWQAAPDDRSEFYDEEFATQFTAYDPDRANDHLDRVGLTRKDGEGFRLRPDGKRLVFQIEVASPAVTPSWVDGTEMVTEYWRKVGVDVRTKSEDRTLFYERKDPLANQHDAGVWSGDGGLKIEIVEPRWYFPFSNESLYAVLWADWFSSRGKRGQKPSGATLRQMELYWQLTATVDVEQQKQLFREILKIAKEQFYCIGTVRIPNTYGIVKDNFYNVPNNLPESAVMNTPAPGNPEQWFIS
ncbi:ABC transporter substrate-binding protein [Actinopolymorpha pittospori]